MEQHSSTNSVVQNLQPTSTSHLVKYEDLNHHRTLFAGRAAEWLIEASFIAAARALGKPEDLVCAQVYGMTFRSPSNRGDLAEIVSQIGHVGAKSLTVVARLTCNGEPTNIVQCAATFVAVDTSGKPYQHGIVLPEDYLRKYSEICNYAKEIYVKEKLLSARKPHAPETKF